MCLDSARQYGSKILWGKFSQVLSGWSATSDASKLGQIWDDNGWHRCIELHRKIKMMEDPKTQRPKDLKTQRPQDKPRSSPDALALGQAVGGQVAEVMHVGTNHNSIRLLHPVWRPMEANEVIDQHELFEGVQEGKSEGQHRTRIILVARHTVYPRYILRGATRRPCSF